MFIGFAQKPSTTAGKKSSSWFSMKWTGHITSLSSRGNNGILALRRPKGRVKWVMHVMPPDRPMCIPHWLSMPLIHLRRLNAIQQQDKCNNANVVSYQHSIGRHYIVVAPQKTIMVMHAAAAAQCGGIVLRAALIALSPMAMIILDMDSRPCLLAFIGSHCGGRAA